MGDGDREVFTWVFDTLRSFHNYIYELPFSVALKKIINKLGLIPATSVQEMGGLKTGYLLQALNGGGEGARRNTAPLWPIIWQALWITELRRI